MCDIFSVSSGSILYWMKHKPSKAAPGKYKCKIIAIENNILYCNIIDDFHRKDGV